MERPRHLCQVVGGRPRASAARFRPTTGPSASSAGCVLCCFWAASCFRPAHLCGHPKAPAAGVVLCPPRSRPPPPSAGADLRPLLPQGGPPSGRQSGAALAGWPGVAGSKRGDRVLITDGDLFPPGYVELNGYKVMGDFSAERVVAYTATLIRDSGSGLTKLFHDQLRAHGRPDAPGRPAVLLRGGRPVRQHPGRPGAGGLSRLYDPHGDLPAPGAECEKRRLLRHRRASWRASSP